MATSWTDPTLGSSVRVRATHINELRSVVNQNRTAASLAVYAWTDSPTWYGTRIRAVHFTELRNAIQDLWNHASMGTIGAWSAGSAPGAGRQISARDTTDLRNWIGQYQAKTGYSYGPLIPVTGAIRGLHLPAGGTQGDLTSQQRGAATQFNPGTVVVLSSFVAPGFPNFVSYLKAISPNVEILCRYYPTSYPPLGYSTFEGYSNWQDYAGKGATGSVMTGIELAQAIVNAYDQAQALGVSISQWYPGNEPEIEWVPGDANATFTPHTWDDLNYYYRDVYYQVQQLKGERLIQLYPPAFATFSSVGVSNYYADGSVTLAKLSAGGPIVVQSDYLWSPSTPPTYTWQPGDRGFDHVQSMIEYYTNGSSVGRVNWHCYFWPGRQATQTSYNYFPSWLQSDIGSGFLTRITEYAWIPDCFKYDSGCIGCEMEFNANLDCTSGPCAPPAASISAWGDYNDFLVNQTSAGGAALWILGTGDGGFTDFGAVDQTGATRPWFTNLITLLNQGA